jgi:ankyrin repeat protein
LHVAASSDELLLVQCLVNNEADINVQNMKGETPLNLACKADVYSFLLNSGVNNQWENTNGATPDNNFEMTSIVT